MCEHSIELHKHRIGACEVPRCRCKNFLNVKKKYRYQFTDYGTFGRIYNKKNAENKIVGRKAHFESV